MDRLKAQAIAERHLRDLSRQGGAALSILPDKAVAVPTGWVFFYQSTEYLRTGDPVAALAGNGPLHIHYDGTVRRLSTARPWEEQVADIGS
jgi:hypothetical protein